jgi:polysaccharide biosynthesis protein PslH
VRILIIAPFFPLPLESGGHTRLFCLIKRLSRRHTIDFASPVTRRHEGHIAELRKYCRHIVSVNIDGLVERTDKLRWAARTVRRLLMLAAGIPMEASGFYFASLRRKIDQLLAAEKYDIVQVEYPRMALHLRRAFFADHPCTKVMVDYDLTYVTPWRQYMNAKGPLRRLWHYADYRLQKAFASSIWRRFDHLVVMSDIDRAKALGLVPEQDIRVVPNGVDLDEFRLVRRGHTNPRLVMLGGAGHWANVDGYHYFVKDVLPMVKQRLEDVSLHVVGAGWDSFSKQDGLDPAVRFEGFVGDLSGFMAGTTILVVPIRVGGGTRLKVLEAMAMGVPVISTSVGCEGIDAADRVHFMRADTAGEFAACINEVLTDTILCSKLIANARALVEAKYGWDSLAQAMGDVYAGQRGRGAEVVCG